MSSHPPDPAEEFVFVATMPASIETVERVLNSLTRAGIQSRGGASRVFGLKVQRKHRMRAIEILKNDAEAYGYEISICSDR